MKRGLKRCLAAALLLGASQALAQAYPAKPVRVLVGLAPGGGVDLIARIFTPKLSESLGQPFIVENRPGGGSILAAETVAHAAPDGYTLLFSPYGPMAMNPTIYTKLSYSPTRDFTPVALAVTYPLIVSVHAELPVQSVKELVGWLKANPGKANCAGTSNTFLLAIKLLTTKTGTDCTFIQYKGSNQTAQALITGEVHFSLVDAGPIFAAIQGGKVRGVAVTTPERDPTFPGIPSVVEAGFPELEMRFWMGLLAPAATPAPVVRRLETEMLRLVKMPEVVKQLHARQVIPAGLGSEEFARAIVAEIARWDATRKAAGIAQIEQ